MGRFLESAKKSADELERMAAAAERLESAVAGSSFTPVTPGNVTFNVYAQSQKARTIGFGGRSGALDTFGSDDGFASFLRARGVTAKYQLENSAFIAVLRAEFEKLLAKTGTGIEARKLGLS